MLEQIWDTKPKMWHIGILGEVWFFLGHVVKNQDSSRKSGMDGHLRKEYQVKWLQMRKGLKIKDLWKEYIEKLINEENDRISAGIKEEPADCNRIA